MVYVPQYRLDVYKKLSENVFAISPINVTGITSLEYNGGIDTTKDVMKVRFPGARINGSAYDNFMGKRNQFDNVFQIDDEIKFYAYYGSAEPSNLDDSLIIAGRVASFERQMRGNEILYTVNVVNRTEELLNTLVPYSSRFNTGTANTSPTAIKQIVNRLNQFNSQKNIIAGLTSETMEITGSSGKIEATDSNGDAFPTIDYNQAWKPAYYNIEQLSSPEYTGDDRAGQYIFYVAYTPVLPQYQDQYGPVVNELVWKPKGQTVTGSLIDGVDISDLKINFDISDVQNMLIVNAGTDKRGNGVVGVAYNVTSIGEFGMKGGYYTKSRRIFSEIATQEERSGSASGVVFEADGMPQSSEFPLDMTFQARDPLTGTYNGSTLTADDKKEWNQFLRDEARWQAIKEAEKILEKLGEPKYKVDGALLLGSNTLVQGNIYSFVVPSFGWEDTENNPAYRLRITDISHTFDANGWNTGFVAEEDEKVISEVLNG